MQRWNSGPPPLKKGDTRATLRRIATSFTPYRAQVVWVLVAVFISSLLGLLPPFFLRVIVDRGLSEGNFGLVTYYTLLTLAATAGQTGLSLWYGYLSVVIGQRIMRDLRAHLFTHLQKMSIRFFTGTRTGEIQSRLANDVGGIQSVVSETAANTIANVTTVLSTVVAMFWLDWRLTLLAVGVLPLFAFIGARVGMFARNVQQRSQEKMADMNAITQETLSINGALLTKTSGRGELTVERFSRENEALAEWQVKRR